MKAVKASHNFRRCSVMSGYLARAVNPIRNSFFLWRIGSHGRFN
jgi:hypothetical protein